MLLMIEVTETSHIFHPSLLWPTYAYRQSTGGDPENLESFFDSLSDTALLSKWHV